MLHLNEVFNKIHFDVLFIDKINLFSGLSGEGKTFLFMVLDEYLLESGVIVILIVGIQITVRIS